MRWLPILTTLLAISLSSTALAQIQLDRFYPPALGTGADTSITAEGKFPSWPCAVECDRDDIKLACDKTNGRLTAMIASNVAPGVAWVRLHDAHSASNLLPLLIEPVTVTSETKDPNDRPDQAIQVALPAAVAGRLERGGDVDTVRVSLKARDTLIASLIANQVLGSPMDAVLQIADLQGNVLAQSDDVRGLDPQLVYRPKADMDVVIRIFAFPATPNSSISFSGAKTHLYLLRMTTGPFLDHVSPIVLGGDQPTATAAGWNLPQLTMLKRSTATSLSPPVWYLDSQLGWYMQSRIDPAASNLAEATDSDAPSRADSLPVVFTGRISESKQVDRLRFQVVAGKKYTARSFAKSQGFLLDAVLRIVDVNSGKEIARHDDRSRTDFDAIVEFKAQQDGEYEMQVSDAVEGFGKRHAYGVWLGESTPKVQLSVSADHYLVAAGDTLEIPVTVARTNGFAEQLSISVVGLPQGVSVVDAISAAKGDSAKSVKLKLSATADVEFQGNVRFVGVTLDKNNEPTNQSHSATFKHPAGIDLSEIWLTVHK